MSKILKDVSTGCWVWRGAIVRGGYGTIYFRGKYRRAHRVAWELYKGEIPLGMKACHMCDNPPCINPSHLFLGTNHDNVLDKVRKNRHIKGEAVNTNKLSKKDVLD